MFFFFNDTATTEIYTLSLHDALPISSCGQCRLHHPVGAVRGPVLDLRSGERSADRRRTGGDRGPQHERRPRRSEEHTSELQSRQYLVCRLLLENKKTNIHPSISTT